MNENIKMLYNMMLDPYKRLALVEGAAMCNYSKDTFQRKVYAMEIHEKYQNSVLGAFQKILRLQNEAV